MTSVNETPPRLNCQDCVMTSRTASTHKKNGDILLRPWTRRQISPSCGEPLNELMAEQNVRQRTKQLPLMEARSRRPSSLPPGATNSSTHQSWEDTFLRARWHRHSHADLVRRAIKISMNSKAFGSDKFIIFHLKHLGP